MIGKRFIRFGVSESVRRVMNMAIFWSYAAMLLRLVGLFVVLPLLTSSVDSEVLGIYYLFFALMSFSWVIDLGLSASFLRAVGYAWAGASKLDSQGIAKNAVQGAAPNMKLLRSVFFTMRWFFGLGALVGGSLVGVGGGLYLLAIRPDALSVFEILSMWAILVGAAFYGYSGNSWQTLLQGINRVRDRQMFFSISILGGYLVSIPGLLFGWGLWAMVFSYAAQMIIMRCLCEWRVRNGLASVAVYGKEPPSWPILKTVWPNSWRFGLAQGVGSLAVNAPVMISSWFFGLGITGSVGLAHQLALAVTQFAGVGFGVKIPLVNQLRSQNLLTEIIDLIVRRGTVYLLLGCGLVLGLTILGPWFFQNVVHSETPLPEGLPLILILLLPLIEGFQAMFQRVLVSANAVPFWRQAIVSTSGIFLFGSLAAAVGELVIMLFTILLTKFVLFDSFIIRQSYRSLCGDGLGNDSPLKVALSCFRNWLSFKS